MPQDTRLARLLHVLLHMYLHGGATTSATIAQMLQTNPVVVRRTMAGLRDAGYVVSNGGRAGGWSLGQHFDRLTVADVYRVISTSRPFAFGPATDNPECPVESAANSFLVGSMATTENFLLAQFSSKKLLDLVQDIPSQQKSK